MPSALAPDVFADPSARTCTACKRTLPATPEHFHRNRQNADGLHRRCKPCRVAEVKDYKGRNPQKQQGWDAARRARVEARTPEVPETKPCVRCKEAHPADEYTRDRTRLDGLHPYCKRCRKAEWKELYPGKAESHRARAKAYAEVNADRVKEYGERYRRENAEERRARVREWRAANPDRVKASKSRAKAKRRAILARVENTLTTAEVRQLHETQGSLCHWCRRPTPAGEMHLDHVIPLARGGVNTAGNVVLACRGCNLSKGAKLPEEWAGARLVLAVEEPQ